MGLKVRRVLVRDIGSSPPNPGTRSHSPVKEAPATSPTHLVTLSISPALNTQSDTRLMAQFWRHSPFVQHHVMP